MNSGFCESLYCDETLSPKTCQADPFHKPIGADCGGNGACLSNACDLGKCVELWSKPNGAACSEPSGRGCQSQRCSGGICTARVAPGGACTQRSDCDFGSTCASNVCEDRVGTPCTFATSIADCGNGYCECDVAAKSYKCFAYNPDQRCSAEKGALYIHNHPEPSLSDIELGMSAATKAAAADYFCCYFCPFLVLLDQFMFTVDAQDQ